MPPRLSGSSSDVFSSLKPSLISTVQRWPGSREWPFLDGRCSSFTHGCVHARTRSLLPSAQGGQGPASLTDRAGSESGAGAEISRPTAGTGRDASWMAGSLPPSPAVPLPSTRGPPPPHSWLSYEVLTLQRCLPHCPPAIPWCLALRARAPCSSSPG